MSAQGSQTTEDDDLYETTEDDDQYEKDLLTSVQAAARQAEELRVALARSEDTKLELREIIGRRDVKISELVALCQEKEARMAELEEIISREDARITELVDLCQDKDARLAEMEALVSEAHARPTSPGPSSDHQHRLAQLEEDSTQMRAKIAQLSSLCQEKDEQLAELERTSCQKDARISELEVALRLERDAVQAQPKLEPQEETTGQAEVGTNEPAQPTPEGAATEPGQEEVGVAAGGAAAQPAKPDEEIRTQRDARVAEPPNVQIPTIQEEEDTYKVSELDLPTTPVTKLYPRQSIGQWSESRIKNNMSVRSLVKSMEKQRIK